MTINTVRNYCEELKYKNPDKSAHILPILGSFHIEVSFMSVIYKRLKESDIEDLLVEAGLITQGSVVQALGGSHYNRAIRLIKLLYQTMLLILVRRKEKHGIVRKTIWYHPRTSMTCLNPLATHTA